MYDTATQIKISQWRAKAVAGTLSREEMIEATQILMEGRRSAAAATTTALKSRTTARKAEASLPSGDDLLSEMLS